MNSLRPLFAFLVGVCLLAGCASHRRPRSAAEVPDPVRQAFREKFPSAELVEWKLKSDRNYEAELVLHGTEIASKFSPAGRWLETESGIPKSDVPRAVEETIALRFKNYRVIETQSVQRPNDEALIYELHLDNGRQIVKVQFSANGAVLNQSAKSKR